ncbi:MAG: valine--tRNA ligase [Zestosphaera sp.]
MTLEPKVRIKRWEPSVEEELLRKWIEEEVKEPEIDFISDDSYVVIDTPPPYPSGEWGVGQAAHYAQIDMVARALRILGHKVLLPFYADRNGLPAEVVVERKYGISAHEIANTSEGRLKFLEMVSSVLDEYESTLVRTWRRLGCSYQYWTEGTDSPNYRRLTQATFMDMWSKGLIYEAERPVMWCPRCRTSLAEAEIEFREEEGKLYYIKFRVAETGEDIVIATTRPELLNGCGAVIFHPDDSRYKYLEGKHAVVPLYDNEVPIIASTYANPDFGTGLAMMCSYGDTRDIWFFKEQEITPRILINPDGTMNEKSGFLKGLTIRKARDVIADELKKKDHLLKEEFLKHEIPVCWRCKTPVEYIHVKEFFLRQIDFKDEILKIGNMMSFKPPEHKIKFDNWVNSLKMDWPISRTRFYGTEIPIWRCSKCGHILLGRYGEYVRPWIDPPPHDKCPNCGASKEHLLGETRTFDTWFDSSVSVLYVTRWLNNKEAALKALDRSLRPQGYDIIRTWLYYSTLRVWLLAGKPPFKWVRISGMGLDPKGRAMHKSLGNIVPPMPYIEKYGADAFRYWAAASGMLGSDYRWSEGLVRSGQAFATKLVNIGRFISFFDEPSLEDSVLKEVDRAMIKYAVSTVKRVLDHYRELDVFRPINELYTLAWDVFASNYLEIAKMRAYGMGNYDERYVNGARYTLHRVFKLILKALHPIMPFVTDYLWRCMYSPKGLRNVTITDEDLSVLGGDEVLIENLIKVNSAIWKYKKENNISFAEPLEAALYLPQECEKIADEIRDLHKVRTVVVGLPKDVSKAIKLDEGIFLMQV